MDVETSCPDGESHQILYVFNTFGNALHRFCSRNGSISLFVFMNQFHGSVHLINILLHGFTWLMELCSCVAVSIIAKLVV